MNKLFLLNADWNIFWTVIDDYIILHLQFTSLWIINDIILYNEVFILFKHIADLYVLFYGIYDKYPNELIEATTVALLLCHSSMLFVWLLSPRTIRLVVVFALILNLTGRVYPLYLPCFDEYALNIRYFLHSLIIISILIMYLIS